MVANVTHEHEVYNNLTENKNVVEVHTLFGEFDYIIKYRTENHEQFVRSLKGMPGIINVKNLGKIVDESSNKIFGDLTDKIKDN